MMNGSGCGWGGGRKEGQTNDPENNRGKRWGRSDRLKVLSIINKSLGTEGSMSEVGIPPPHNSDKPHALVAANHTHTHIHYFCFFPGLFSFNLKCVFVSLCAFHLPISTKGVFMLIFLLQMTHIIFLPHS